MHFSYIRVLQHCHLAVAYSRWSRSFSYSSSYSMTIRAKWMEVFSSSKILVPLVWKCFTTGKNTIPHCGFELFGISFPPYQGGSEHPNHTMKIHHTNSTELPGNIKQTLWNLKHFSHLPAHELKYLFLHAVPQEHIVWVDVVMTGYGTLLAL